MTANLVDVNLTSNGLNVGLIDYVLLVRKLMKSLPKARDLLPMQTTTYREQQVLRTQAHVNTLKMTVRIESAMRLKNPTNPMEPPSSFVRVKSPFEHTLCNIETKVVN
jgi:hypothetical protein